MGLGRRECHHVVLEHPGSTLGMDGLYDDQASIILPMKNFVMILLETNKVDV